MANDDDFGMTDLAEHLSGPQAKAFCDELGRRLDKLNAEIAGRVASGLPLGQLQPFQDALLALAAARSIVVRASLLAEQGVGTAV